EPSLNFVKTKIENNNPKTDISHLQYLIKKLFPITINHFQIYNGKVHLIDNFSNPKIDACINNIKIIISNLSNIHKTSAQLPAHADVKGEAYEGHFKLHVDFDALEKNPTF